MDKESDVIRHQMEETRASLTDKLEILEHQVADTVTGAAETVENVKNAVQETVQNVKDTVRGTVDTVTETLDVRKQVEKHPWAMMAGATAVGFVGGCLTSRMELGSASTSSWFGSPRSQESLERGEWGGESASRRTAEESISKDGDSFQAKTKPAASESPWTPAIEKLKGLAIGTTFGVLRDVLTRSLPSAIQGQVSDVINDLTTSLGGKTISGHVLPESGRSQRAESGSESWKSTQSREWAGDEEVGGSPRPRQTAMADVEE